MASELLQLNPEEESILTPKGYKVNRRLMGKYRSSIEEGKTLPLVKVEEVSFDSKTHTKKYKVLTGEPKDGDTVYLIDSDDDALRAMAFIKAKYYIQAAREFVLDVKEKFPDLDETQAIVIDFLVNNNSRIFSLKKKIDEALAYVPVSNRMSITNMSKAFINGDLSDVVFSESTITSLEEKRLLRASKGFNSCILYDGAYELSATAKNKIGKRLAYV